MAGSNQGMALKRNTVTQARGRERREKMLRAATELLSEKELSEISFNDVAALAGIPKGSAYHFYANVMELYAALTEQLGAELFECLSPAIPKRQVSCWEDVIKVLCKRVEQYYAQRPGARKLLVGGETPPQFKRSDRDNDRRLGALIKSHLAAHFQLPVIPNDLDVFFYAVEIVDLFYCLSMIRHNRITEAMGEEAILAGIAYLRSYLPAILPSTEWS
jgi:AcrR family transcriptional regulator